MQDAILPLSQPIHGADRLALKQLHIFCRTNIAIMTRNCCKVLWGDDTYGLVRMHVEAFAARAPFGMVLESSDPRCTLKYVHPIFRRASATGCTEACRDGTFS